MTDRTVHAHGPHAGGLSYLVRYNKAGKWYQEFDPSLAIPRRKLTFDQVIALARWMAENGGHIHWGRHGGHRFDSRLSEYR